MAALSQTWLAVVQSLVTPLGALFWVLFDDQPFRWRPNFPDYKWFAALLRDCHMTPMCSLLRTCRYVVASLVVMVPGVFLYRWFGNQEAADREREWMPAANDSFANQYHEPGGNGNARTKLDELAPRSSRRLLQVAE